MNATHTSKTTNFCVSKLSNSRAITCIYCLEFGGVGSYEKYPELISASLASIQAHIALGGNIGDVRTNFMTARQDIAQHPACQLMNSSLLYQTPAIGPAGQDDYLNAVIDIQTTLTATDLLDFLQSIEKKLGRIRKEHWGARTLDLDIINYNQQSLHTSRLTLPHAHMPERQFVLKPLCDIDQAWLHPDLQLSAQALLEKLLVTGESALPEGVPW